MRREHRSSGARVFAPKCPSWSRRRFELQAELQAGAHASLTPYLDAALYGEARVSAASGTIICVSLPWLQVQVQLGSGPAEGPSTFKFPAAASRCHGGLPVARCSGCGGLRGADGPGLWGRRPRLGSCVERGGAGEADSRLALGRTARLGRLLVVVNHRVLPSAPMVGRVSASSSARTRV